MGNQCMLIGSFAVNGKTWMEVRGTGTLLFGNATEESVIKLERRIGYGNRFSLNLMASFNICNIILSYPKTKFGIFPLKSPFFRKIGQRHVVTGLINYVSATLENVTKAGVIMMAHGAGKKIDSIAQCHFLGPDRT